MNNKILFSLFFLFLPAAASAQVSLSGDFSKMMTWLSGQVVDPLAFNAGSTFDPPNEVRPGRVQSDISFGAGILPLDTSKFPVLSNPTLNQENLASSFPQEMPFPDLTGHVRIGLPWRTDLGLRASDTTIPNITVTPGTTAGAQANNLGVELRTFFFGRTDEPTLSLGAHANRLWGQFTFANSINNVNLDGILADASNKGSMAWDLSSVGMNAVVSQHFGSWTPFGGLGYDMASGSLKASLNTTFNTFLATPSSAQESSAPIANNLRLLFGTELQRKNGHDLFVSGEFLLTGAEAHAFNIHLGMMLPTHIGPAAKDDSKAPVLLDSNASDKQLQNQNLIFIK
jgi:hypothetical protein